MSTFTYSKDRFDLASRVNVKYDYGLSADNIFEKTSSFSGFNQKIYDRTAPKGDRFVQFSKKKR
jgi:hypothetical protein